MGSSLERRIYDYRRPQRRFLPGPGRNRPLGIGTACHAGSLILPRTAGKDHNREAPDEEQDCYRPWEVEETQNLIHNRRLIVGLVLAILIAAAIVLILAYSGGGHGGGEG